MTSQDYVDIYGLFNVKPCVGGIPSGNDGPIITAYAIRLGLPIDKEKLRQYYNKLPKRNNIPRQRLPGVETPPPSRDSLLGWVSIGLLDPAIVVRNKWSFVPVNITKTSKIKMIATFILSYKEHRNFIWSKELYHAYPLMFSVPLQDRAYYCRLNDTKVPVLYHLIETIDKMLKPKNNSPALIRWLKYNIDPGLKCFQEYFGNSHPITIAYMSKMQSTAK